VGCRLVVVGRSLVEKTADPNPQQTTPNLPPQPDIAYHTPAMERRPNMRNSRGFTMIEILVAMAILVILISIVAFTVSGVISGAKKKETAVRMQSMTSMLTELQTATKLTKQPAKMYYGPMPATEYPGTITNPPPFDIWKDGDPSDNGTADPVTGALPPPAKPIHGLGQVTEDAFNGGIDDRARASALLNTQIVMGMLAAMPVNRAAIEKTSTSALMTNPLAGNTFAVTRSQLTVVDRAVGQERTALKPAIFVDAWNNPIIFVPAAGLQGVALKDSSGINYIVTSTSLVKAPADMTTYRTPGTARPFFASAGPDGDFSTGDDNVYSFED